MPSVDSGATAMFECRIILTVSGDQLCPNKSINLGARTVTGAERNPLGRIKPSCSSHGTKYRCGPKVELLDNCEDVQDACMPGRQIFATDLTSSTIRGLCWPFRCHPSSKYGSFGSKSSAGDSSMAGITALISAERSVEPHTCLFANKL